MYFFCCYHTVANGYKSDLVYVVVSKERLVSETKIKVGVHGSCRFKGEQNGRQLCT